MKQEPLQNLKQRTVRCLLAILALLTMPAGMWAEEYNLWVAGTQVSSDNASDVLGDGKVSWNNSSNTLTLNNATLSGSIEKTATETGEQLIINLVGTNTVNGQILFQSPDRMYPGDLTFTGSGSLNIASNDENGVIDGVSSVNTAEGLYIATDTPDPICYNGYYIAGNSGSVMSLTVSTNVTYPVWVYNTSTTHYTQLTAATSTFTTPEQNADENHSGSVSFSNNTLTLTNFLCKTTENNDFVFYIGKSLQNLTVNLVGESYIHQNSFHYAQLQETEEEPTLTFTTSDNGKLTFEGEPSFWGDVTLIYENGLGYYSNVISTDWPRLLIGGTTYVRGTTNTVEGYDNVSFDDATNTLTLNGVTIGTQNSTVTDITVYIKDLNVEISGTNTVYGRFYGFYEENGYRAGTITFKKKSDAETANLTVSGYGEGGPVTNFVSSTLEEGLFISGINTENEQATYVRFDGGDYYDENGNSLKEVSITLNEPNTKLWIGGTAVTSDNAEDVFDGDENLDGKVSYNMTTQTLSLNGVTIEGDIVSNVGTLTIDLTGTNNFISISASGNATALAFTGEGTLSLENSDGVISGFSSVDFGSFNLLSSTSGIHWSETRHALCDYNDDMAGEVTLTNEVVYPLWINGVQVTGGKAANVLDDDLSEEGSVASVSFDATTNTLTLNGASISASDYEAIVSDLDNLTIFLVGENYITSYGNSSFAFNKSLAVDEATITFTTDGDSNGSLTITKVYSLLFGQGVTPVYTNVSIKSNGDSQTMDSSCGISVGGVDVTEFNKGNVFGDGKVNYNPTTHTLTLNNATIESAEENPGIVYENEDDLTIALIGNNSIQGAEGCTAIEKRYGVETPNLSFVKGDSDQHFSLDIIAQTEDKLFSGFKTNYGNFFVFDEEKDGLYTMTVSSSIFGGTGSENEPFLIKTPDDLKMFADYYNDGKYFSRNSHIKLNNDIDCKDLTNFVPFADNTDALFCGVFDGDGNTIRNLTISDVSYCSGLFGYIGEYEDDGVVYSAMIKNVTLDNCTISGGTESGAIVANMYAGTVSSNVVENSTIVVNHVTSNGYLSAGGIVGACASDYENERNITISGNAVRGTTTVSCENSSTDYNGDYRWAVAGAVIGTIGVGTYNTISNNTYEYSVSVSTKNPTDAAATVTTGYDQRGIGTNIEYDSDNYPEEINSLNDIVDGNAVVLYNTKSLTIAYENIEEYGPASYYEPLSSYEDGIFYLVPGQETTVMLQPAGDYSITSASLSYTSGETPTTQNLVNSGEGGMYEYSFQMPDADATFNASLSIKPSIWIGNIEVAQDGSFPEYGDNASFDFDTNTLTLNGLGYSGYIKSGLDHLTISLVSNEYGNALGQVISLNPEATLTFEKANNDATGNLGTLSAPTASNSVIEGFASVDFGDLNLLSAPYQYDTTAKKLINLSLTNEEDNGITSATLTTATAYPLWVAGNQVTGESVTGDGISKNGEVDEWGVTFSSNTLLLKNVYLSTAKDQTPAIVSGLDALTLQVEGYNSMSFGDYNTYGGFIVQSNNSAATLTVAAVDDNSSLNLNFGTNLYIENPFNNFSSVTYSGKTIYIPGTGCQFVSNIKTPYYNNGDNVTISSADGDYGRNVISYYYTIDYVDEAKTDISTPTLLEEYLPSISSPCTVTAYAQYSYNGVTKNSDNAIAKYFGFTEPMKVVYAGTPVELDNLPALAPAVAEGDGVTYAIDGVSEGEAISFYAETGKYRVEDYGTAILNISIAAGDNTPYKVLNEVTNLTVNVIPPLYVAPIEDIAYTGSPVTPTIVVKASEEAETTLTVGTDYTVSYKLGEDAITADDLVDVATYTVVITGVGDYAGTTSISFNITQATPTITFAQESYSAILGETFNSPETVDNWTVTPTASSNTSVATVSDGLITLVGVGTTTITVTYAETANYNSTTASYQLVVSRALEVAFVGSNSWASYYATEDLALPEGLTAYIVSDVNATSGVVTAQSVGYIPANNGVLLQREANGKADGYVAEAFTGTTSTFNNLLAGSVNTTDVSSLNGGPVYVLFNDKFKRATSGTIPARRAYLPLAVASAGAPQLMTLNVMDGDITAIRTLAADDNDDNWYTLDGFKLSGKPQHKGVYIKNGKKVYFNNHK